MLKIFTVDFFGVYPTNCCLIISAFNQEEAEKIAAKTIIHTDVFEVTEMVINESGVLLYLDGDY